MRILLLTAEVTPFSKVGGLADVCGALPSEISSLGNTIQVISPYYKHLNQPKHDIRFLDGRGQVSLGHKVYEYRLGVADNSAVVPNYFIYNEHFFYREGIYTDSSGQGFEDNIKRFLFFQYAVLDLISKGFFEVDLIHINDHHTSLMPIFLDTRKLNIFTLLTVHNFQYQGQFGNEDLNVMDDRDREKIKTMDQTHSNNSLALGIIYADRVNTVSPTYARELLTEKEKSFGLFGLLKTHKNKFSGILNGADYTYWNPGSDKFIALQYDQNTLKDKGQNKQALLNLCQLPYGLNRMVIGSISRLVDSKGFDLILKILPELLKTDIQFIFLGSGDPVIVSELKRLSEAFPDKIYFSNAFNEKLAHQIEAGADLFLMPSRFEPCGLNQIYSQKYGTPPLVHKTGGLADTVQHWDGQEGTGFVISSYTSSALLAAIIHAEKTFQEKQSWKRLMLNAMKQDFSWSRSATKYVQLYQEIINKRADNG